MPQRAVVQTDGLPPGFWIGINVAANRLMALVFTTFPDGIFRPHWCRLMVMLEIVPAVMQAVLPLPLNRQNIILAASIVSPIMVVWFKYRDISVGAARQQTR